MRPLAHRPCAVALAALLACGTLTGCGSNPEPTVDPPSTAELISQIQSATPTPVTPQQVAEAFALGANATTLQRELIEKDLIGSVVEWDVRVYDVDYAEGIYKLTSQPIPIASPDAVQLLRVVAFVRPRGRPDEELLRSIKTDEVIRLRGLVQDILLRTIVTIGPAVIVGR